MKKSKVEHTTFRNDAIFCLHCGGNFTLRMPMPIDVFNKKIKAFNTLHADCVKTWVEPQADMRQTILERAQWWLSKGETGLSSKTIWACLMGYNVKLIHHPCDPADFGRCYKLLQAIPEWRAKLANLKPLSTAWCNLVDNWDKLSEMYEQNQAENWVNCEKIGMYEFMQTLIQSPDKK